MQKIFDGFSAEELKVALKCLGGRRRRFAAGEVFVREGEAARCFGVVLSGAVDVVRYSLDGREKVLSRLTEGEAFGTSFVLGGDGRHFANFVAAEPAEVLFLDGKKILSPCERRCAVHTHLVCRLLAVIAHRNVSLARKIDCLTQHSTAAKVLSYLEMQAESAQGAEFEIPFTRQQLANYLNVDRSALSTEITRLARAGKLKTSRRKFRLLTGKPS